MLRCGVQVKKKKQKFSKNARIMCLSPQKPFYTLVGKRIFTPLYICRYRVYKNCSLLEKIYSPDIYSMREIGGSRLISNFLALSEQEKIELMDKCSECFKRAILEISKFCCTICRDEMDEERHRRFEGICFRCKERISQ